jgi:hypothetical protein
MRYSTPFPLGTIVIAPLLGARVYGIESSEIQTGEQGIPDSRALYAAYGFMNVYSLLAESG